MCHIVRFRLSALLQGLLLTLAKIRMKCASYWLKLEMPLAVCGANFSTLFRNLQKGSLHPVKPVAQPGVATWPVVGYKRPCWKLLPKLSWNQDSSHVSPWLTMQRQSTSCVTKKETGVLHLEVSRALDAFWCCLSSSLPYHSFLLKPYISILSGVLWVPSII